MAKQAEKEEKEQVALVIASKVKEYLAKLEMRCAGDLPDALSAKVEKILLDAIARTKANDRGTVQPRDL